MASIDFDEPPEETIAERPEEARSRWKKLAVLGSVAVALTYGWYMYTSGNSGKQKPDEPFKTGVGDDIGFRAPPLPKSENKLVMAPPAPAPAPVVAPPTPPVVQDDSEARRLAEEERLRREAEARRLAAERERFQSKQVILSSAQPSSGQGGLGSEQVHLQGLTPEDDPNRRFLANAAASELETSRAIPDTRPDALVPAGTMIRGTLETAIQSDLPGQIKATTSEDVYSYDGRRILIPKGSTLIGEYRSGLARGQTRIFVAWTSVRSPAFNGHEGYHLNLGSYGTDSLGRSGVSGEVDEHYVERFSAAALLSVIGGVSSFVAGLNVHGNSVTAANGSQSGYYGAGLQAQTQAQNSISQSMSDMANQALKDSISIPPTINVDQGTPIIVFVKRDLDFRNEFSDPVKERLYELRHPGAQARRNARSASATPESMVEPSNLSP